MAFGCLIHLDIGVPIYKILVVKKDMLRLITVHCNDDNLSYKCNTLTVSLTVGFGDEPL